MSLIRGRYVTCMRCLEIVDTEHPKAFSDEKSRREFVISGFCQACQDATFTGEDEELFPENIDYDLPEEYDDEEDNRS